MALYLKYCKAAITISLGWPRYIFSELIRVWYNLHIGVMVNNSAESRRCHSYFLIVVLMSNYLSIVSYCVWRSCFQLCLNLVVIAWNSNFVEAHSANSHYKLGNTISIHFTLNLFSCLLWKLHLWALTTVYFIIYIVSQHYSVFKSNDNWTISLSQHNFNTFSTPYAIIYFACDCLCYSFLLSILKPCVMIWSSRFLCTTFCIAIRNG